MLRAIVRDCFENVFGAVGVLFDIHSFNKLAAVAAEVFDGGQHGFAVCVFLSEELGKFAFFEIFGVQELVAARFGFIY